MYAGRMFFSYFFRLAILCLHKFKLTQMRFGAGIQQIKNKIQNQEHQMINFINYDSFMLRVEGGGLRARLMLYLFVVIARTCERIENLFMHFQAPVQAPVQAPIKTKVRNKVQWL